MPPFKKVTKIDFANHNLETCRYLLKGNSFHDWVLTTAFYSSIHFLDDILFPYSYRDVIKLDSIEKTKGTLEKDRRG